MADMAGLIFPNIGIFGGSGSGKSTFAKAIIAGMLPNVVYYVCVNESKELSEFAARHEYIPLEKALGTWDAEKLAAFIRHYKRVHFEVDAPHPVAFMDALARAIKSLGQFDATTARVLLVVDECHKFLSKVVEHESQNVQAIDAQLRKWGVVVVKITPFISSTSQDCISHSSLRQCRQQFVFPMNADVDIQAAKKLGFPDPSTLLYPDPERNLPGEYFAKDNTKGTMFHVRRLPDGSREALQIGGLPAPLEAYRQAYGIREGRANAYQ
jgi:hypothetical protein